MLKRRDFLKMTSAAAAMGMVSIVPGKSTSGDYKTKVVAFDAFALFNANSVVAAVEKMFPKRGAALSLAWRAAQFEYTWLRNSMGKYDNFWNVTRSALRHAARASDIAINDAQSDELMQSYLSLRAWPDAAQTLDRLKEANIRLAILSNFTLDMMRHCVVSSGLEGKLDALLSTDEVGFFKPAPLAYRIATTAFKVTRPEVLFVAFGGWDAVGAKAYGYRTYWANRASAASEDMGYQPDANSASLDRLVSFATTGNS
jgi:2-haloacid dehalogenase